MLLAHAVVIRIIMQKPKYLHAVGNVFVSVSVMPVASFINLRVQYSQQYSLVNKRVLESFPLTGLSRSSRLDSCFISQFIPVQSLTGQTTFNRQSELIKEVNGFLFNVDVDVLFFCFLSVTRSRLTCPCTIPHLVRPVWPPS